MKQGDKVLVRAVVDATRVLNSRTEVRVTLNGIKVWVPESDVTDEDCVFNEVSEYNDVAEYIQEEMKKRLCTVDVTVDVN